MPTTFVLVGTAALLLCGAAGVVYFWQQEMTLTGYAVLQAACLLCQAVTLLPAIWDGVPDLHHNATLAVACGTGILGMGPGLSVLALTGNGDGPPIAAVLMAGVAILLACTAGLITGTFLASYGGMGTSGPGPADNDGDTNVGDFDSASD
ncbi:hypothetical protein [Streptomyces sp. NPDC059957]|uniref:hypothetical protein n=1 Tax=Streptomyces sp. NPDC059957 TaxID=3347016 RepID=UPI00366372DD